MKIEELDRYKKAQFCLNNRKQYTNYVAVVNHYADKPEYNIGFIHIIETDDCKILPLPEGVREKVLDLIRNEYQKRITEIEDEFEKL